MTSTAQPSISADASAVAGPAANGASAVRGGALAMLPLIAGYVPFALAIGIAAAEHGAPLAGWAGSWLIYGGSAHLATIRTIDEAGAVAAVLAGLLINARLLVYSASLARRWRDQPRWFRVVAAGLIIDPTWAAAERHAADCLDLRHQRHHFIGAGLTLGVGWSGAIAAGVLLGARIDWLDLDVVVPLCLLGLVGPGLRSAGAGGVFVVAGAVALLTSGWPAGTGLLAAIAAGCAAGLASDERRRS